MRKGLQKNIQYEKRKKKCIQNLKFQPHGSLLIQSIMLMAVKQAQTDFKELQAIFGTAGREG